MKKIASFVRNSVVLLIALGTIHATRAQGTASGTDITNTNSNYFLQYAGTFFWSISYSTFDGHFGSTTGALGVSGTLNPSATKDYNSSIALQSSSLAHADAASHGWSSPANVTSFNFLFTFSTNSAFQQPSSAPSSADTTITYSEGTPWEPSISGGSGGTIMWCVAGYTNWGTGSWVPPGPGTYSFYVAVKTAPGYQSNATDPIQGPMEVNFTGYTLTVN